MCVGVHTCMHALLCFMYYDILIIGNTHACTHFYVSCIGKKVESDLKHGLKIGWKSEESIVCSLG